MKTQISTCNREKKVIVILKEKHLDIGRYFAFLIIERKLISLITTWDILLFCCSWLSGRKYVALFAFNLLYYKIYIKIQMINNFDLSWVRSSLLLRLNLFKILHSNVVISVTYFNITCRRVVKRHPKPWSIFVF